MTATELATAQGFAVAPASPRLRTRVWRGRFWWIAALVFAVTVMVLIATSPTDDTDVLSTRNPGDDGARAAAEVLRSRGVDVRQITELGAARITRPDRTTLAIALPSNLIQYQILSVLAYPGDIVFVGVSGDVLEAIDPGLAHADIAEETLRGPRCDDPDAIAAERISSSGAEVSAAGVEGATVCFDSTDGVGPYVVLHRDGRTITLLANATLPMNGHLTDYGNAALTFRALGKHESLVWYLGNIFDTSTLTYTHPAGQGGDQGDTPPDIAPTSDFLPPGTGDVLYALALAIGLAAIWLGRRMGPLVSDNLPVVVPSSETTRGRARLYRRARAYGRAAASLRAAAAERMGRRLGVPRSGDAGTLISAIARATGRDRPSIERLIYGPPPTGEDDMMVLVKELDTLERQVHRP